MKIPERQLAWIWQHQAFQHEELTTRDGQALRVVFPGRANGLGGPDFRQAILATDEGETIRGDIEIHVKASQWREHGHHRDRRYNGVVLHVVGQVDGASTCLENGRCAPVLCLQPRLLASGAGPGHSQEPCQDKVRDMGQERLNRLLDVFGDERLEAKVRRFEQALQEKEPGQVLYEGVMEALGYSRNQGPFRELARRLPLSVLEQVAGEGDEGLPRDLETLLLGSAGLLHGDSPVAPLIGKAAWQLLGVRPVNLPGRRLTAMACLLQRYGERGLLVGLLDLVRAAGSPWELMAGLIVEARGCGNGHRDTGRPGGRPCPALLGRGRAGEIAVNGLLPFSLAFARVTGETALGGRARHLYRVFPPLEENEITREMKGLLLGGGGSALSQQGLIHIYNAFCEARRCPTCPLAQPSLRPEETSRAHPSRWPAVS